MITLSIQIPEGMFLAAKANMRLGNSRWLLCSASPLTLKRDQKCGSQKWIATAEVSANKSNRCSFRKSTLGKREKETKQGVRVTNERYQMMLCSAII